MELKGLTGSDMNKLTVATMQVDALRKQVTDAQATIAALQDTIMQMGGQAAVLAKDAMAAKEQVAALQARVSELQGIADEKCRCFLERAEQSEKQLTQRTAELEAAKAELEQERVRLASCLIAAEGGTKDIVKQGDYGWSHAYQATLTLQAELERVRGLVKALPKVEGEIAVKRTEVDLSGVWGITLNGYFTFQSALFDSKEEADAYAALLTRRQGME